MSLEGALAVTRFGLGARMGEIDIASRAPKEWLLGQLRPNTSSHAAFNGLLSSSEIYKLSRVYRDARSKVRNEDKSALSRTYSKAVRVNFEAEIKARSLYAAQTERPFHERLTRFWSNHFSISARNRDTRLFPGAYERESIRPQILGSFFELAISAIFHPGMLMFLDNVSSMGPRSYTGQKRKKGLNENLAREVLELHTITPAAGYSQSDVTEFAKALTGWSIERKESVETVQGKLTFNSRWHEPGTRKLLGKKYKQKGPSQAVAILKDLCKRPETAQNIAYKLAAHFVSDVPPQALVDDLKRSFLTSNGDLTALYKTLINSPHAWSPTAQKVKTPEELIISTSRMIGYKSIIAKRAKDTYDSLAQHPFTAPTPEGWSDMAKDWIGPDAILKRIEWANELSSRLPKMDARSFLKSALGARLRADTLDKVSRAESGQQAFVLALMSPDFQRR